MDFNPFYTLVPVILVSCAVCLSVGSGVNLCREDFGFPTLDNCNEMCSNFSKKTQSESSNDFEELSDDDFPEETADIVSYKSIFLTETEFNITNGKLRSSFGDFNPDEYFIKGNITAICIPVHSSMAICPKQHQPLNKVQFNEETRQVWIEKYQKAFPTEMYAMNHRKEIRICRLKPNLSLLHLIGFFASAITLAISLTISFTFKVFRSERNWPLTAHIAMLCLAYISLLIKMKLPIKYFLSFCLPMALLQQFFFLSAFFWVNVQAIVVHSAFTRLRSTNSFSTKAKYCRFLVYGAFAWGIALFIMLVTLITELEEVPILRPKFRENCWFHIDERATTFLYYYGPLAASLFLNFALFIHIVIRVRKLAHDASAVNKKAYKQLFCLAIKLVFILGFCWIIKVVSWLYGRFSGFLPYLDVVTAYQGVLISIAYLANATVIKEFKLVCLKLWSKRKSGLARKQTDINMSTNTVATTTDSISSN